MLTYLIISLLSNGQQSITYRHSKLVRCDIIMAWTAKREKCYLFWGVSIRHSFWFGVALHGLLSHGQTVNSIHENDILYIITLIISWANANLAVHSDTLPWASPIIMWTSNLRRRERERERERERGGGGGKRGGREGGRVGERERKVWISDV